MTFEWYDHAMTFCVFSFIFFYLETTFCLETTFEESNWMKTISVVVMFFSESIIPFPKYLITAIFKVLYQQLRDNLTTAFERHHTTEYFMDIGVKLAPRHLTYYCMPLFLSNKPSL